MTNLTLNSNIGENQLFGVGNILLQNETISITAEPNTVVTLLRGINKVILLSPKDQQQIINGPAIFGDVYTLENEEKRLVVKVENQEIKHDESLYRETSLYINPEPVYDSSISKRKTTLTAGVIVLFLLLVSVVFGVKQKNIKEFNLKSEEKLNTAIVNYDLLTRESFILAKETAIKLKDDGYKNPKLDDLLKKINETESEILGEVRPEVKEMLDLTLQVGGFNGGKLISTGETMFVMDTNEKNIIQVDVNGKNAEIVARKSEVEDAIDIASYEERLFTIDKDGINEVDNKSTRIKDSVWSNPLFYLYSANIYLVDRDNNQILRFSGNGKTFGDKTEWLAPGIEADFSKVIDMTIDGSIWLLSSSGKVTKFTNGNPVSITMEGIVEKLENPTAIYTNENQKYVYILDKEKGRIIALEKNGKFKMQYVSDKIKEASDLVVSEEEKKIVLLSGSKLMYIGI